MKANHRREIIQLWWVAEQYFAMGQQVTQYLTDQDLQTTVRQLANKCQHTSDIKGTNALLMLLNAHLASCAVRLNTIDERLGGYCKSTRWKCYKGLVQKGKSLRKKDVTDNLEKIVHCMLRHNVAHEEYHLQKKSCRKKQANKAASYKTMQDTLMDLKIEELYDNIRKVKESIKNDIASIL